MQDFLWRRRAVVAAMTALATCPGIAFATAGKAVDDPFALGVASGDPSCDGFVLWTRLVGAGATPMQGGAVPVGFEVADDPHFRHIVRAGEQIAHPEAAHSLHVELYGLRPGRPYWYRFHTLGTVSPVGRTATTPHQADRLRLALTSCQHWELGWFGAYRDMLAGDPDLIVQVGDYIYEQSYPDQPRVRDFDAPEPRDLAGYRARYALYRTDPDLQEAHRQVPWLVTWDDHEVWNDYAGLANREGLPPEIFAKRRAAAYQAYFEHMPIRPSLWRSMASPRLYRGIDWGDLASLSMLDTRQYRSPPPCAAPSMARNVKLDHCADRFRPDRTMLGDAQEHWLARRMADERRPWTLLAQGVFFAPLSLDGTGDTVFSDQWDGYAASRSMLLDQLARPNIRNGFVLSGDVHSFWLNDLHRENADAGRPVATEIVTSALAAQSPPAGRFGDALVHNPHIRFSNVTQAGYVRIDINRARLHTQMRAIDPRQAEAKANILTYMEHEAASSVRFGK